MFYEMISKFGFDALSEIPDDIEQKLGDKKISDLIGKDIDIDDTTSILDFMWNKTKEICEDYIDNTWIKDLKINEDDLLNDIKEHAIFTIYLSIINHTSEGKDILKCEEDYITFIEKDKEAAKLEDSFEKKRELFFQNIGNGEYGSGFNNSDLYYYLSEGIKVKENNDCIVNSDSLIFSQIVSTWSKSPFNLNNSNGITFDKLFKFHKEFEKLINRANKTIDKYTRAFIIERLFNISFLTNLVSYINNKYNDDINKYNKYFQDFGKEANNQNEENYSYLLFKENEIPDKFYFIAANRLLALSELVSIPMVFSRSTYFDSVNTSFESNMNDLKWKSKFRSGIYYLNSYLIPLLIRVYYIIIFYKFINEGDYNTCIKDFMEKYITDDSKDNIKKYNYKKFYEIDENLLRKCLVSKPLQVNATEIIYNYRYSRNKVKFNIDYSNKLKRILKLDMEKGKISGKVREKKNDKKDYYIYEDMKKVEEEIYSEELYNLNCKYDYNFYVRNFPNNLLYSNYIEKKK